MNIIDFKSISELMNFVNKIEQEEPYPEEKLSRDVELSEGDNYEVQASIRSRGALTFDVPDITRPLGLMRVEAGVAVVEGFGGVKIPFKRSFIDTPGLVKTTFGFFELRLPIVTVSWRRFNIGWWSVTLPVPNVSTMTIRIPTPCFLMNVRKDGFEVFNVIGRTYIAYLAIGR